MTEEEDDDLILTEGTPSTIHCHVTQVVPVPKISMSLGSRDLTRHVAIKPHKNIYCTSNDGDCTLNMDFDVCAVIENHNATWLDDGKNLICNSLVQNSGFLAMEVHKKVKVFCKYLRCKCCNTCLYG